jgi:hypothetical protein
MSNPGLLVVLLWQTPVGVDGSQGRLRFVVGAGADEAFTYADCAGSRESAVREVSYRVAAVEGEFTTAPRVRLRGVTGMQWSDHQGYQSPLLGGVLTYERGGLGFGGGLVARPPGADDAGTGTGSGQLMPSLYLRAGPLDRLHVRAEAYRPTALAGQEVSRLALGYNLDGAPGLSGSLGVGLYGAQEQATALMAEVDVPLTGRFGVGLRGHVADGELGRTGAFTGFFRWSLPAPVPALRGGR